MTAEPNLQCGMAVENAPRYWIFWVSLAQLISWGTSIYWFPLVMPEVERSIGLSRAESSLAISLAIVCEGICGFYFGKLVDQGHARRLMTLGSLGLGFGLILHGMVQSALQFYLVWSLIGMSMAATLYTPLFAVTTRRFPNTFRRAIITITFLGGLASTAFIPLSAWLVSQWDWRVTCFILGSCNLLICLPIHFWLLKGEPSSVNPSRSTSENQLTLPFKALIRTKAFLALGLFMVLGLSITAAIPPHLISLLRERGLSEAWAIGIPAMIGVLQVVGRAIIFWIDNKWDEHKVNRAIVILMPIAIGILLIPITSPFIALCFACLFGLANGSLTIVKGTSVARYINREHVAALNGILALPIAIARASAPLVLGLLWSPSVGYQWGVWFLFVLSTAGFVAFVVAQNNRLIKDATS